MSFPVILSTSIKNISGAARFCAYLGRHGVSVANGATYVEDGDLIAKVSGNSGRAKRLRDALAADLQGVSPKMVLTRHGIPIDEGSSGVYKSVEINGSDAAAATTVSYA
jgi:hypothetical protein